MNYDCLLDVNEIDGRRVYAMSASDTTETATEQDCDCDPDSYCDCDPDSCCDDDCASDCDCGDDMSDEEFSKVGIVYAPQAASLILHLPEVNTNIDPSHTCTPKTILKVLAHVMENSSLNSPEQCALGQIKKAIEHLENAETLEHSDQ